MVQIRSIHNYQFTNHYCCLSFHYLNLNQDTYQDIYAIQSLLNQRSMWNSLKHLKPSEILQKFRLDEQFHALYKKDVLFWSKGEILKNIKEGFHENLPQDKLEKWLEKQRPIIKDCFQRGEIQRYELVGSTSVPGMAGMMSPDVCLFIKTFPPHDQTIDKLQSIGYKLAGYYNIDNTYDDLWFLKRFQFDDQTGIIFGGNLHIWKKGSITASKLIAFRDLLRSNKKAFDEYKNKKLQIMNKDVITNDDYTIYKLGKTQVASEYLKIFRQ